jgi:hypothetical protein
MHDANSTIARELEQLAPADDRIAPDWDAALRRAGSPGAHRRRTLLAVVLPAAALMSVALTSVALSSGVRNALGLGNRPIPVLEKATLLVSAPVGNHFYAHAWHGPSSTGGACIFLTHDHAPAVTLPRLLNGGGACSRSGGVALDNATAALPLAPGLSIGRRHPHGDPAKWVPPVVFGSVYGNLHATRVEVVWNGGSHRLELNNGWFLGGTPKLYRPPFAAFPFRVVAYDRNGGVVARKRLESPTLRLLSGGWKEYARKYHAWKRHRR